MDPGRYSYSSWVLERTAIGDVIRLRLGVSTIGRHPSSIIRILDTNFVSRNHAQIEVSEDDKRVEIRDLNSVNGVFINNTLYRQVGIQLSAGDQVGIGVCINADENDVDLEHPIYVLKYVPIRRASNPPAENVEKQLTPPMPADKSTTSKAPVSTDAPTNPADKSTVSRAPASPDRPSVSTEKVMVSNAANTTENICIGFTKQQVNPGNREELRTQTVPPAADIIITISDDDSEAEARPKLQRKTASNLVLEDTLLPIITSVVGNVTNENALHFAKDTSSSKDERQVDELSKSTIMQDLTATATTSQNVAAIETSVHMPVISNIKKELVRSVSADIKSIFGETDDVILEKMKEINPYVFNDLNGGKPMQMISTAKKPLLNGDFISLSSDEDDEEPCASIGYILNPNEEANKATAQLTKEHGTKSLNIFDTSLNDSKEYVTGEQPQIAETSERDITNPSKSFMREGPANDHNPVFEDKNYDEDAEELMFSQVIINEMKDELALNKGTHEDGIENDDFEENDDDLKIMSISKIKSEPEDVSLFANSSATTSSKQTKLKESESVCWLISDEEDFDEELETKVTGWSTKLFSQSFSLANMSQVYDLEEEEEDDDHTKDDLNDTDDDAADYNNFYNRGDANRIMDNMFMSLKDKLEQADTSTSKSEQEQTETRGRETPTKLVPIVSRNTEEKLQVVSRDEVPVSTRESPSIRDSLSASSEEDEFNRAQKPFRKSNKKTKLLDENKLKRNKNKKHVNRVPEGRKSSVNNEHIAAKSTKAPTNEIPPIDKKCEEKRETIKAAGSATKHSKPLVIDAPHLPKHKGKCRGVSAVATSSTHTKNLATKLNAVRETFRHEGIMNDLKRKWQEKPSVINIREKEKSKNIKESRKERLKELAEKQHRPDSSDGTKRKLSTEDEHRDAKKPKIKVTTMNRGAFLTEDTQRTAVKQFTIPKVQRSDSTGERNAPKDVLSTAVKLQTTIATDNEETAECDANPSLNNNKETFSQVIRKPDELLLKQQQPKKCSASVACSNDSAQSHAERKEAITARAQRTTNKITFASMQKNFLESHLNEEKLKSVSIQRSCLCSTENRRGMSENGSTEKKKKKTVRFNETPVVHFIERVIGARKKVDQKDLMPRPWFTDRRHMTRCAFPILDCTDKIISMILAWSNEWLIKRNATADAAADEIYPMPYSFRSFDYYKSIIFPLMKLEYVSMLEREYNTSKKVKPIKASLETVTENKKRLLLIAKYNSQNKYNANALKCDMVILDFGSRCGQTFAFISGHRRGTISCGTIVLEILPTNISKQLLGTINEFSVLPVVDNVRVEFGAFQAVYQLQATPLFSKILDPLELLKCKPPLKRKIAYKGFDKLNDEQRQILLGTYIKIIDESMPNITLIQGPPGTGKSRLITNLALQSLYGEEVHCMDKKILICAQSNGAVDVLAEKLYRISQKMHPEVKFRIVRFGLAEKISPSVAPISLQRLLEHDQLKKLRAQNPDIQIANKEHLRNQMSQLAAEIADLQTRHIKGTVQEDELLEKQRQLQLMQNIATQSMRPEDERNIFSWYLTNANIVCATLSSCVKLSRYIDYFDICIIDEATQCTEPWTLLPLKFGINSLVLVGDTQQLPATVLSKKASDFGLGTSIFTRIQRCLNQANTTGKENGLPGLICSLRTQYRMHPEICKWPNAYFYKNELENAPITKLYKSALAPFSILNLAYSQDEDCSSSHGKIVNTLEANFVVKLLKVLDGFLPSKYNSYGVITPYAHHRDTLYAATKAAGLTNVMVNTIDSYQGIEKDVIIISNARTSGIGFLSNYQRLNVALTRPKKCLILCGNFKNLESVPAWKNLLNNARERKLFHEISAVCVEDVYKNVIDKIKIKR